MLSKNNKLIENMHCNLISIHECKNKNELMEQCSVSKGKLHTHDKKCLINEVDKTLKKMENGKCIWN